MQTQQPQIPIPNHKTFNMYSSIIIKNYIPSLIQMFKLQTHHDLILNNKIYRYVTNIFLVSQRWLKVFVMFQNNLIYQIFETQVNQTIRSIHQIQKSIILELDSKLICLSYEPGNFKTVGMISLEFIRLRYGYTSMLRVDNSKKYIFMIAGDYLLFILNPKSKQFGIIENCPLFQKALDEVKWVHHDYNYFQTILYTKVNKPFFKSIMDVQFDKSNIYFLVIQKQVSSIYVIALDELKIDATLDTLFTLKFTNLPNPCYKLAVLTSELNSSFLVFSQNIVYHMALWQELPISKYEPPENTSFMMLKARPFNPSHIYYQDNNGIHVLKILPSGEMESIRVNSYITSDFCMTTVSINGCLAYLSNGKCIVQTFEGSICIYSWINSILDFYIGKNIVLALQYQESSKQKKQNNKVIAIKRNYKCLDKVTSHPKKTFIQNLLPAQISSIGNTKYLLVKALNKKNLYKDSQNLTLMNLQDIQQAFQIKIKSESFLGVYSQNGDLSIYEIEKFSLEWKLQGIVGKVLDINQNLFSIQSDGILSVIDFEKKLVSKFKYNAPQQLVKIYVSKQNISFVKRTFNDKNPQQSSRYLLYVCTSTLFEIYILNLQTDFPVLAWHTPKISSGLAILFNTLDRHKNLNKSNDKINKPNDEYRSISDPHYIMSNLVIPQNQIPSKFTIVDFRYIKFSSQTILIFLTSGNNFYLYKQLFAQNSIGLLYKRIILPLHQPKSNDFNIVHYGPNVVRFGSRVLYDDVILEITQPFKQSFMLGGELWIMGTDNKLRLADIKGNRISGKLVYTVAENNSYHAIDNTPEYYVFFTRDSIQLYDKDLKHQTRIPIKSFSAGNISSQQMITAKASQSMCAISSYQYFKSSTQNFQSYKFVFFVYDFKDKQKTDPLVFEDPVVSIKFGKPGRVVFTTSSYFYVYDVKQNKLQVVKTYSHSLRSYLGGFAYWRSSSPHFMVFGGALDGLSFAGFEDEKLIFQQKWFEPLKFGTRDIQIFGFGKSFKAIIADSNKNIIIMDLNIKSPEKLYDLHLGTLVNKLTKIQDTARLSGLVYCCCADGTIRAFTAINRQQTVSFRKFQKHILDQLPLFGGLALQRKIRQQSRSYKVTPKGNIVQSSVLELFYSLSQQIRDIIIQRSQFKAQQIESIVSKNCIF